MNHRQYKEELSTIRRQKELCQLECKRLSDEYMNLMQDQRKRYQSLEKQEIRLRNNGGKRFEAKRSL